MAWIVAEVTKCRGGFTHQHRLIDVTCSRHISESFDRVHKRDVIATRQDLGVRCRVKPLTCAIFALVTAQLSGDNSISAISGHKQTLAEWLTTFNILAVVIDPYTHQSGWILPTAARLFGHYEEADIRCCFVVTSEAEGAAEYLGPFGRDFLVLLDPERKLVAEMGLETVPAIVHINQDGSVAGSAEGWQPAEWSEVLAGVEEDMDWRSKPILPGSKDPGAFEGTPAAG
jgi:hypothetical protein